MSSELEDQLDALYERAYALDYGPARTELLEEAVRLADAGGDRRLAFDARQMLIDTAQFSGRPDTALVAFTWCLAAADDDPSLLDHQMLWHYKWIVGHLPELPRVTRAQIDAAVDDMERRFRQAGAGAHAVAKARWRTAEATGDLDVADEWQRRWRNIPRDRLSDCHACDVAADVETAFERGRDDEGMRLAEPILTGRLRCAEVPHETLADVLLPALRTGRLDDARVWHLRGYRMVASNPEFLSSIAQHLVFLAVTGNHDKGLRLVERHLRWAYEREEGLARLRFLGAAGLLLDRVAATGGPPPTLRLPPGLTGAGGDLDGRGTGDEADGPTGGGNLSGPGTSDQADGDADGPGGHAAGERDAAELAAIVAAAADELAAAFDARNGNGHWSAWLAGLRAIPDLPEPLSLTRSARRRPRSSPSAAPGTDASSAGGTPPASGPAPPGAGAEPGTDDAPAPTSDPAPAPESGPASAGAEPAPGASSGDGQGVGTGHRPGAASDLGPRTGSGGSPGRSAEGTPDSTPDWTQGWTPPPRVQPAGDGADAWFTAGEQREDVGDDDGALDAYREARERYEGTGEGVRAAECDRRIARLLGEQDHRDEAVALLRSAEHALEAGGDDVGAAKCSATLAMFEAEDGDVAVALSGQRARLDRLTAAGSRLAAAVTLGTVATLLAMRGDIDTARAHFDAARRVFTELGTADQVTWCNRSEALQLVRHGQPEAAVPLLVEVIADEQAPAILAGTHRLLAVALWNVGRLDEAIVHFAEALALHERYGPPQEAAICARGIGELHTEAGRHTEAVERFTEAVDRYEALGPGYEHVQADCERDLALALARADRPWEAAELLEQSRATLARHGDEVGAADSGFALAMTLEQLGEPVNAAEEAAAAAATFERAGLSDRAGAAHHRAAQLLDRLDRDHEAIDHYEAAQGAFTAAGSELDAAAAQARRGTLLGVVGRGEEGLAEIDAAANQFAAHDALYALGRCHDQAALVLAGLDRIDEALGRCDAATACFEAAGNEEGPAEMGLAAGRLLARAGRSDDALTRLRDALARFERLGIAEGTAACHGVLADVLTDLGRHDEAAVHERALEELDR
jgi:tetratricopeptide (TPR) repeat protein